MSADDTSTPVISEPLTWAEICERHPEEWVCLVEIDKSQPNRFDFRTARVVGHGKAPRDPLEQANPWWERYREIHHYFTRR